MANLLDFINEAGLIDYPFEDTDPSISGQDIATNWIYDLQLVFGPSSNFEHQSVYLSELSSDGTDVTFTFTADTTPSINIIFVVPKSSSTGTVTYEESNPQTVFGFIQTGDLSQVPDNTFTGQVNIEPTLCRSMFKRRVTSLNIANEYTTLAIDPDCSNETQPTGYKVETSSPITGDVQFTSGRFSRVSQLDDENEITFATTTTALGGGNYECQDYTIKPDGWTDLSPACNEIINTVNGLTPNPETNLLILEGLRGVTFDKVSDSKLELTIDSTGIFNPS